MNHRAFKYILDVESIISEIDTIKNMIGNNFLTFSQDFVVKRAIERDLEIIGEAVRNLVEIDPSMPLSATKKIIGLRNIISHAYDAIDDELIWGIIQKDIPILKEEIKAIKEK